MWIKGLDEIDNKIVNLLLDDGRISYSEIGKILGLSRTTVKNRITVLEEDGIIVNVNRKQLNVYLNDYLADEYELYLYQEQMPSSYCTGLSG